MFHEIENSFGQLSQSEQLQLIERLVHHINEATLKRMNDFDEQLPLMASDEEIQREMGTLRKES